MPKVNVSITITLHLGPMQNNEYIKMGLEIAELDTDTDIHSQLEKCESVIKVAWREIEDTIGNKAAQLVPKLNRRIVK